MNKIIPFLFFVLVSGGLHAQFYKTGRLSLISETGNDSIFEAYTEACTMNADFTKGHLRLWFPLQTIKTNNVTYDSLFAAIDDDTVFTFRGNFTQNIFDVFKMENDGKQYDMQGKVAIGNNEWPCEATFDPLNVENVNDLANLRMDIKFVVDPVKNYLPVLSNILKKPITFIMKNAALNARP